MSKNKRVEPPTLKTRTVEGVMKVLNGQIKEAGKVDTGQSVNSIAETLHIASKWEIAQMRERELQNAGMGYAEGLFHYAKTYENYFRYVGLGKDLSGLTVIEVGAGDYPALNYCHNFVKGFVVDPLPSDVLIGICEKTGLELINIPFESAAFAEDQGGTVEVWLFNLLQHVEDPKTVVDAAKKIAHRIRFFEPINEPITDYHLHTFTLEDYQSWFGQINLYKGGAVPGFHTADCAYGVWHR